MSFAVVKVEPTGTRKAYGFRHHADGSVTHEWEEPVYPESPQGEAFRETRRATVGLRDASKLLGLSPEIVCGLEFGRYVFADADDWDRARDLLRKNATRSGPGKTLPTPWPPEEMDLP